MSRLGRPFGTWVQWWSEPNTEVLGYWQMSLPGQGKVRKWEE